MNEDEKLHASLRSFYNRDESYFEEAGESNSELTPERRELFAFIPEDALVVDVGSGGCENADFLKGRARYIACDLSGLALQRAKKMGRAITAAVQAESQALPFKDGSVDAALSTYALEHFVYPERCLNEMWRICRKGGRVILISPAYDHPLLLPPSVGHWPAAKRAGLIASQAFRQFSRHISPHKYFFSQVRQPRVLEGAYQPDFDAVHLVSAREIGNFFRERGAKFLFERKRIVRPSTNARDFFRNVFLRMGLGEYGGLNLQLAVEKP